MKNRLIDLLKDFRTPICEGLDAKLPDVEGLADYLVAEGVIVPPCKVGDAVYDISSGEVLNCTVEKIEILLTERMSMYIDISIKYPTYTATDTIEADYFAKTVFFTREEAEKALAERIKYEKI